MEKFKDRQSLTWNNEGIKLMDNCNKFQHKLHKISITIEHKTQKPNQDINF
jgi:hypothetical protein